MPGKPLALSKTLEREDYTLLGPELARVDAIPAAENQASDHRRWEYAMALHAIEAWFVKASGPAHAALTALDVGGAGSRFGECLQAVGFAVSIIDPDYNYPLERILQKKPLMQAAVVTCISVIEHVPLENLSKFILALGTVVMPGGLLFLTCDYAEDGINENHHFHWMRSQIFDEKKLGAVAQQLWEENKLVYFGGMDPIFHGPMIYPAYTFASLCMKKENLSR